MSSPRGPSHREDSGPPRPGTSTRTAFFFSSDDEEIQEHAYGIILASTEMFEEELNSLTCHKLRSFIEFNSDEGNTPTLVRVASGWVRYDEERRIRHINCFISAGM